MTLRNGKFYEGDTVIPLEFGNKKQIQLIDAVTLLKNDGAIPTLIFDEQQNYICGLHLTCVCGSKIECHWKTVEEGFEIEGTKIKCNGCDFIYKVCSDEDNFLFFKIFS